MATESRYDVVIVGARCAGATLATFLARAGASVLLLDKDRLPSDQILSTHTIHPPGLDVLDDVGVGDAVRAVAPPTHIMRLKKNDAFVDIEFPTREPSIVLAGRGSTVSCRTRQRQRESSSSTERGWHHSYATGIALSACGPPGRQVRSACFARASLWEPTVGIPQSPARCLRDAISDDELFVMASITHQRWRARDVEVLPYFFLGQDEGALGPPSELQQVVFARASKAPALRARLAATMEHRLSPTETFPVRHVLWWALGAAFRRSPRVLPQFIAKGKRVSAIDRELGLRRRLLAEAETPEARATPPAIALGT